jgi:uncharacterized protein YwgA
MWEEGNNLSIELASGKSRMNRYQLAKIVEWAGTLDTRKRMQKVAYLLQVAGCPLDADFSLHHYGPYVQELARLTDEMVQANLLVEKARSNQVGQQFSYCLAENTRKNLAEFEATPQGQVLSARMSSFEPLARQLFQTDLKELEYASTIVFFHKQGHDWPVAVEKMCQFKELPPESQVVKRADALAREIVA